ncbi:TMEM175 family protein [Luteimicrobium subarcticum]|uniref:Putative membrane protein n=1 Tax=Luteimicrobium subarcticum TaxID=620910 RepID=A0A2M8WJA1_9MICO|nr:TMEM175 family protein [Luteimicrobium subarcticum]PJI90993.1 putative membrane protein [Luteimicrobium subarcticum]
MNKGRLEAFSDGVLAIVITIMVLELRTPEGSTWEALREVAPTFLTYLLSFVYVGIYWNNHHHMLQLADRVDGVVLWANLHLLFWLSLFPFTTGWMDETGFDPVPTAVYGIDLLLAAVAYWLLQASLVRRQGHDGPLAQAVGGDWKGKASPVLYLLGIAASFWEPYVGVALYVAVALVWLVPDRRVERFVAEHQDAGSPVSDPDA